MVKKSQTHCSQNCNITFKILIGIVVALVVFALGLGIGQAFRPITNDTLPPAEAGTGERGAQFGVDANINEATIDDYLGRSDSVYRDMRLLVDPADYSAIGGDSYLSGYVDGFEIVPYPYLVNVTGLPEAVGQSYTGPTLFTINEDGSYTANYKESMAILEDLFPKDKNIFLMCGGAGYAGQTKDLLTKLGWDASKIYNVGGYWFYEGNHDIKVKNDDGTYAFWKVPYHTIDFTTLTPAT
ncbi:hypothetical protein IJI91_03170 [Candidatus Saccharibacteria bacterium]|nr:hypothetical protein [Candidatus Saccharibacteria bacterium]